MPKKELIKIPCAAVCLIALLIRASSAVPLSFSDKTIGGGDIYFQSGEFSKAADYFQKELSRYHPQKDFAQYLTTLIRLADCYQEMGLHDQAESLLENFSANISTSADNYRNALFYNALADCYLSLQKLKESAAALEKASKEAHLSQNVLIQASVLNTIGSLFMASRQFDRARNAFNNALTLLEISHQQHELYYRIQINTFRSAIEENAEPVKDMASQMDQVLNSLKLLKDHHEKAALLMSLGVLSLDAMKGQQTASVREKFKAVAFKSFDSAAAIGDRLNLPNMVSFAFGYLGSLYELDARYEEALQLTRQAVFYAQNTESAAGLYKWQQQAGRLYAALNNIEAAIRSYQQAAASVTPICQQAAKGYRIRRNRFEEDIKPVFLGLTGLLIQQALSDENSETRQLKLLEARNTMELFKTVELQDFFHDECVAERRKQLRGSTRNIDPGVVVIYPILLPDQPILLADFHDSIRLFFIGTTAELLKTTVMRVRKNIQEWKDVQEFYDDSHQLYDWLIRPIEPELSRRGIHTIIAAPDGALALLPLSVLLNKDHFLIETYALATIPAWSLTETERLTVKNPSALIGGLSEGRTAGGWTFPSLDKVPDELTAVGEFFKGKQLFNKEFTLSGLQKEYRQRPFSIVHLATHGLFTGSSEASFILTYDGRLTLNLLEGLIDIGRYRKQPVELLTLNGCQTAVGDERAAFGLAGAAVKAGVHSVLATLWSVDDAASYQIIVEFYRLMKQGTSKAQALQIAQKKMIQNHQYWHPAFWAAFLLVGNWN